MTNTDPAAFSSETTGVFKVQPLGEAVPLMERADEFGDTEHLAERLETQVHVDEYGHRSDCPGCAAPNCGPPVQGTAYGYAAPYGTLLQTMPPVSLVYVDGSGGMVRVDTENPLTHPSGDGDDSDNVHRERLLLRALLEHTLAMLKGEDVS